jgi:hypothetical protein
MPIQNWDKEPGGLVSGVAGNVFARGLVTTGEAGQLGRLMAGSLEFYIVFGKKIAGNYSRIRTLFEHADY